MKWKSTSNKERLLSAETALLPIHVPIVDSVGIIDDFVTYDIASCTLKAGKFSLCVA